MTACVRSYSRLISILAWASALEDELAGYDKWSVQPQILAYGFVHCVPTRASIHVIGHRYPSRAEDLQPCVLSGMNSCPTIWQLLPSGRQSEVPPIVSQLDVFIDRHSGRPAHPSVTFILGDYRSSGPTRGGYRAGLPIPTLSLTRHLHLGGASRIGAIPQLSSNSSKDTDWRPPLSFSKASAK